MRRGYEEAAVDDYLDKLSAAIGQEPTPEPEDRDSATDG